MSKKQSALGFQDGKKNGPVECLGMTFDNDGARRELEAEAEKQFLALGGNGFFLVNVGKAKPIIDEIDRVLAEHYGFTDEELDFIINYDIKYRLGAEEGEE